MRMCYFNYLHCLHYLPLYPHDIHPESEIPIPIAWQGTLRSCSPRVWTCSPMAPCSCGMPKKMVMERRSSCSGTDSGNGRKWGMWMELKKNTESHWKNIRNKSFKENQKLKKNQTIQHDQTWSVQSVSGQKEWPTKIASATRDHCWDWSHCAEGYASALAITFASATITSIADLGHPTKELIFGEDILFIANIEPSTKQNQGWLYLDISCKPVTGIHPRISWWLRNSPAKAYPCQREIGFKTYSTVSREVPFFPALFDGVCWGTASTSNCFPKKRYVFDRSAKSIEHGATVFFDRVRLNSTRCTPLS